MSIFLGAVNNKKVYLSIDEKYKNTMNDNDFYPYIVFDENKNIIGKINLTYRNDLNAYQISNSKIEPKGKGYGKLAYKKLIKNLDKKLYSDSSLTKEAEYLWKSLVKENLAKFDKLNEKYISK
jgi:hypothetical protein